MKTKRKRLPLKMAGFLAAYAKTGSVKRSAKRLKMSRYTHAIWLRKYPEYVEKFHDAHDQAMVLLEDMAQELATIGEQELVVNDGKVVFIWRDAKGKIVPEGDKTAKTREPFVRRKIVPSLLIFKLKAEFPDKYRERQQVDLTTGGQSLNAPHPTQALMNQILTDPAAYAAAGVLADRLTTGNVRPNDN